MVFPVIVSTSSMQQPRANYTAAAQAPAALVECVETACMFSCQQVLADRRALQSCSDSLGTDRCARSGKASPLEAASQSPGSSLAKSLWSQMPRNPMRIRRHFNGFLKVTFAWSSPLTPATQSGASARQKYAHHSHTQHHDRILFTVRHRYRIRRSRRRKQPQTTHHRDIPDAVIGKGGAHATEEY